MPRQAREIYCDEYYHVIVRGNGRQWLFDDEEDFSFYLTTLDRYRQKYDVHIYHYCLMNNHVHLLMKSVSTDHAITKVMHGTSMLYAFYFQKKHKKTGHVFEDRFKNEHIDSNEYLLECGRYIERNPLRAKLVSNPGDYRWSSYGYYAKGCANHLITENPLYADMGSTAEVRRKLYADYVEGLRPYDTIMEQYAKGQARL